MNSYYEDLASWGARPHESDSLALDENLPYLLIWSINCGLTPVLTIYGKSKVYDLLREDLPWPELIVQAHIGALAMDPYDFWQERPKDRVPF